ncbi:MULTISPECIES: hypothetical protein [Chryseobacterium]|uniref:hypothetical protein n=1 Tax=Chryseobacterium TaxID=59732 RepID=UPI001959486D|nr:MULTISPECIES: hypothetical protein [Chryseobacterium]MBM7419150.1 hypothetical protein [Chryseobacterium sp. JUb44]MDH6209073.1 hypothetical protein [Chryseobacterium sp. BIGb0186]WSO11925.1 hypothetical protein VUJ64_08470 [Chryseobacterium scophthalmum]
MKKIIVIFVMLLSGFTFAQESSDDNVFVYDTNATELEEEDVYPANPGDVLIDDYIPALLVVAVAFVIAYANKKKVA